MHEDANVGRRASVGPGQDLPRHVAYFGDGIHGAHVEVLRAIGLALRHYGTMALWFERAGAGAKYVMRNPAGFRRVGARFVGLGIG